MIILFLLSKFLLLSPPLTILLLSVVEEGEGYDEELLGDSSIVTTFARSESSCISLIRAGFIKTDLPLMTCLMTLDACLSSVKSLHMFHLPCDDSMKNFGVSLTSMASWQTLSSMGRYSMAVMSMKGNSILKRVFSLVIRYVMTLCGSV